MTEKERTRPNLQKAIAISAKVHEGQVDKAGKPYIDHPLAVMRQLRGEKSRIVGVLHDVIEDTALTEENLRYFGFSEDIIKSISLVTKPEDLDNTEKGYLEWIESISASRNQTAIDVKWADLTHNSDTSRIKNPTEKDRLRLEKYKKAKRILLPFISRYLVE